MLTLVTILYLAGILAPFLYVAMRALLRLHRDFDREHVAHEAWMQGLNEGAGLREKTRRMETRRKVLGR